MLKGDNLMDVLTAFLRNWKCYNEFMRIEQTKKLKVTSQNRESLCILIKRD